MEWVGWVGWYSRGIVLVLVLWFGVVGFPHFTTLSAHREVVCFLALPSFGVCCLFCQSVYQSLRLF
ncbi:hypothetical protein BKA61DRAFT_621260, partial [Leptodontidium sp. MPI-SDFR-AT-0119]